jgi:hypothetical protein
LLVALLFGRVSSGLIRAFGLGSLGFDRLDRPPVGGREIVLSVFR